MHLFSLPILTTSSGPPSLVSQTLPAWVQILGFLGTALAGFLAYRQSTRATVTQEETKRLKDKQDASDRADERELERASANNRAIEQAREIYEGTIKIQEQTVLSLLDGQRRLQGEVTDLRGEVREGRREREESDRKLDAALRRLSASQGLVTKLTGRVNTLEGLLTTAGIVFPLDDSLHHEGTGT